MHYVVDVRSVPTFAFDLYSQVHEENKTQLMLSSVA